MSYVIDFIQQPWPWYVAGPLIAFVMFALYYFGNTFGMSSNFRNVCSMLGGGRSCDLFDFDWREQTWNLMFTVGAILGGFIAYNFLTPDTAVGISPATIADLEAYGMVEPGKNFVPSEIFSFEELLSWKGLIFIVFGGFLVGFGTRYAGGCTSGHAISGMSNLQPASLLAVVGFFIGGLLMSHFILPHLLML